MANHYMNKKWLKRSLSYAPFLIAIFVWGCWVMICHPDNPMKYIQQNFEITLTMILGSMIAGATSEGGGAVAFPVFTKVLHIHPTDAKVFSLAIQSVGMTAASLTILSLRFKVDWFAIRWASLAGVPGIIFSAVFLTSLLSPEVVRICFTALVSSFAITLYLLSRGLKYRHDSMPAHTSYERNLLMLTGFIGGVISGLVGNGIDIITFSVLVLFFRVNEKIATPTSVILMAVNSVVGFALHGFVIGGFNETVHAYWLAAVPVVVVGAPIGAFICSRMSRHAIAWTLIGLISIEFISSLLIIPMTAPVIIAGLLTMGMFSTLYLCLYQQKTYQKTLV